MVTYKIDLDITPGGIPKIVHVKQYQTDATLEFKLHTRRGTLNVGNYTDCSIRGTKTDGNGYSASASFTLSSNTVTVTLTEQMTAVAGRQPYEIALTDQTGKMITATFYLDVQRAALDGDTISASEIREITNALDHSSEILEAYNESNYDDIPTTGSVHAVKSGGIKTAIDAIVTVTDELSSEVDSLKNVTALTEEQTENINNAGHARCFVNTSGVIINEDYVGETFVGTPSLLQVVGGSAYVCKMFNYTCDSAVTMYVATYNSNKVFIARVNMSYQDFKTFNLASDVAYICVHFNSTSPIVLQDGFQIQIEKGTTIDEKIYPFTAVDTKARNDIDSVKDYLGGSVITGWKENCCVYLSASPTPLDSVVYSDAFRCVVIEVKGGDIVYYSGSDYTAADTGTAARPYGLYNANKELVSYADHGIYKNYEIIIPSGVKYVVLNQAYYIGSFDCYINKTPAIENTDIDTYSAINRVFQIVGGYTDTSLHYNSGASPWYWKEESYGEYHSLTCSDWTMLAFFGIDVDHTTWNGLKNIPGYGFDAYKDLYRLKSDNYVYSDGLCKHSDDCGYTYTPNETMSNCKPGDVIFFNMNPNNDDNEMFWPPTPVGTTDASGFPTIPQYRGIDHSAVFVDKVSDDYYSIMEVAGSPQTDIGYVTFHYVPIGSRTVVSAIRPITYVDVKPVCLLSTKYTKIVKEYEKYYSLDVGVKKDDWVTLIVKANTVGNSWIGVQSKFNGESSYTTVATESRFGSGVNRMDDTVRFTFSPAKGFKDFRIVSFSTAGDTVRGFYVEKVELYYGYAR